MSEPLEFKEQKVRASNNMNKEHLLDVLRTSFSKTILVVRGDVVEVGILDYVNLRSKVVYFLKDGETTLRNSSFLLEDVIQVKFDEDGFAVVLK